MIREKLKKEQIISDLTEKHKNLAQQQEKDKGIKQFYLIIWIHFHLFFKHLLPNCTETGQCDR